MRHLLMSLILLLSFTGCEDNEQQALQQAKHDAKIKQEARAELLTELEAKKEPQDQNKTKLNNMGISVDEGTITIDTNKTKDFFSEMNKKMAVQMKKISDDLEKGMIGTKEAGIEVDEQHIYVDLNKTQDLLMEWGKKIQVFVKEFDEMANTLDMNDSNSTNKGM